MEKFSANVVRAWGRILTGYSPVLSIEITRECSLNCPGCYAYNNEHLGGQVGLRQLSDRKGEALISGIMDLIEKYKPLHVSLVGGEPLVRFRELNELLPKLSASGIHTQLVTSAVRKIPLEWTSIANLTICVSIDGLQPEHDERRKPATYDRILKNIDGHKITVHCTITRAQLTRDGYLEDFVRFWSDRAETAAIWMSLYTPQVNEVSAERLTAEDRSRVIAELSELAQKFPKLEMSEKILSVYAMPPQSPDECTFAKVSTCLSADLEKRITPCQFGGTPDCKNCGCMASAGLAAIGRYKIPPGIPLNTIFNGSLRIGSGVRRLRNRLGSVSPQ